MNLYAATQPKGGATTLLAGDPSALWSIDIDVDFTPGQGALSIVGRAPVLHYNDSPFLEEDLVVDASSVTLGGAFQRVIVDTGDFEYLTAQGVTVLGTLSSSGTPTTAIITGGPVYSRASSIMGTLSTIVPVVLTGSAAAQSASLAGLLYWDPPAGNGDRYITMNFRRANGTLPAATSFAFAFWDQSRPNLLTTPTQTGTGTINPSGQSTILLPNSGLPIGGIGYIVLSDTDGNPSHAWKQHSGPVMVA